MLVLYFNSLMISMLAALCAVSIGFVVALNASILSRRLQQICNMFALVTLALPPFVVTNAWMQLLGQNGILGSYMPFSLYSVTGAIFIYSLMFWPFSYFLTLAGWQKLEVALLESDPMLKGLSAVRYLFWPAARSQILLAVVVTFTLCLNQFSVPALLQIKVFTAAVWIDFNTTFNYVSALKSGWPLVLAPLLLLTFLLSTETSWPQWDRLVSGSHVKRALGSKLCTVTVTIALCILILSVLFPLGAILASSRTWVDLASAFYAGQNAVWNSFVLSFISACLCTAIGVALSTSVWRHALWIPFLIPGLLLGICLVWLLNRPVFAYLYLSILMVIMAWVVRYSILACTAIHKAVATVDRSLLYAARLEGAGYRFRFIHIYWPQISRSLVFAWFVCYLMCLWDVETLIQIVPPGKETLSLRIFNLLHYGHNSQVNALCLILIVLSIIPWACIVTIPRFWAVLRRQWVLLLPVLAVLSGCAPSSTTAEGQLSSALFEKAQIIGGRGIGLGQFNKPRSLTVDRQDNLYVVDMTGRIQKFDGQGNFLGFWQIESLEKGKPKGMAVNKQGHILVVEPHYTRVNYFTPDGKLVGQWGTHGLKPGQLSFPRAIAVDSQGSLWISEYSTVEHIQHFSADGKQWLGVIGKAGSGPGEFNRVEGLWIDKRDRIYAADSCNHRIQVFSTNGTLICTFGQPGADAGQLSYPYDIIVEDTGMKYICEFGNSRIQVFDPSDKPVESIGQAGNLPGQFHNPWSIAMDSSGNIYVADSGNHRVQKLIRRKPLMKTAAFPSIIPISSLKNENNLQSNEANLTKTQWHTKRPDPGYVQVTPTYPCLMSILTFIQQLP